MQRVFRLFAEGTSVKHIASTLNQEGIPAPHDRGKGNKIGRGWPHSTIRAMLPNERYIGRFAWNTHKWVRAPGKKSRRRIARPEDEWVVQEVPALAIVPRELWDRVQERFQRRPAGKGRSPATGKYPSLVSGLLCCGVCGGSITVVGRRFKAGVPYASLGCTTHSQRGSAVCTNHHTLSERKVRAAVVGKLRSMLSGPEALAEFQRLFAEKLAAASTTEDERIKILEKQIGELTSGFGT